MPRDLHDAVLEFLRREIVAGDETALPAPDDPLLGPDGGVLDSVGMIRLIAFLEDDLGLRIDDLSLVPENFASLRTLVDFLGTCRRANGA
jgi:acyl carrier protein